MVPYFNVSTRGGSATGWLTTILNRHAGVVCLHGRRGLFAGQEEPAPADALRRLTAERERLRAAGEGDKTVGIVHVYYGPEPRQAFLDAGGTFASIVRNPLTRIHSLFTHHSKLDLQHPQPPGTSVYQSLVDAGLATGTKVSSLPFVIVEAARPADRLFVGICHTVIDSDLRNLTAAPADVILFERLVSEPDYLLAWLDRLLGGRDGALERSVAQEFDRPVNSHVGSVRLTPEQIFDAWPDAYRKLFLFAMLLTDWKAVLAAYASVGFALPELSVDLLRAHV